MIQEFITVFNHGEGRGTSNEALVMSVEQQPQVDVNKDCFICVDGFRF